MLPAGKQRARTDEERGLRRNALIAAARAAIFDAPYDAITMTQVADAAGVSKGAAYLYFETKEALFLALLTEELTAWFDAMADGAARLRGEPVRGVARLIARSLAREPQLLALLALLHGRLEPNAPEADVRAFKGFLRDGLARVGLAIEAAVDGPRGFGAALLMRTHALAIGIGQMANPPPVVADLLERDASLAPMRVRFEPLMGEALEDMARGMLAR